MNFHFSQPTIEIAFIIGWLAVFFSLFVLLSILSLRLLRFSKDKDENFFLEKWRPLLFSPMEISSPLPPLRKKNRLAFFRLWNYYQESIKGEERLRLNHLAYQLNIDRIALKWLHSFSTRKKLMAMLSLGYLHEKKAWDSLVKFLASKNNLISLTAARALIHICADEAISLILPLAIHRLDWPTLLSENLLREAGPKAVTEPLSAALLHTNAPALVRVIDFLPFAYYEKCILALRDIIKTSEDPEVLAAAMRFLKDPRDAAMARNLLTHPFWPLRLNAIKAIGRIGSTDDIQLLLQALSDSEWWVRYASAQALVHFPSLSQQKLESFHQDLTPKAQEILSLVKMEEALL